MVVGIEVGPLLPRVFYGSRIKMELLLLSYSAFFGVREAVAGPSRAGGELLAVISIAALVGLKAIPGPLEPSAVHLAVNFVSGAFLALAWLPLWDHWVGGLLGGLLAFTSAWVVAGIVGFWHDKRVAHFAYSLRLGAHLEANHGQLDMNQVLRIRRGRWWSVAHADLPVTLQLNNGGAVALKVGSRYLWRTSLQHRAPNLKTTTVSPPRQGS